MTEGERREEKRREKRRKDKRREEEKRREEKRREEKRREEKRRGDERRLCISFLFSPTEFSLTDGSFIRDYFHFSLLLHAYSLMSLLAFHLISIRHVFNKINFSLFSTFTVYFLSSSLTFA
jgi:hypothetical protein